MNCNIAIESWNSATDDSADARREVARILRAYADKLEDGGEPTVLYDVNGNKVGTANFWHADE